MAADRDYAGHREPLLDSEDEEHLELPGWDDDDTDTASSAPEPKPMDEISKPKIWVVMVMLVVTITGFVVQTEAAAYYQEILGWNKSYASFWITHSFLALPWYCSLVFDRYLHRKQPFIVWAREYYAKLADSIETVKSYENRHVEGKRLPGGPLGFALITMGITTFIINISGISWFLSLSLTTPSDLTAIYNCSTFFAAAFSVPLLKERLTWTAIVAVALSIAGTFIIAWGDTTGQHPAEDGASGPKIGASRMLGNVVALIGAVAFGLYEVCFKKWAHSSRHQMPSATLPLTFFASAIIGSVTFVVFWPGLVILHLVGIEPFSLPSLDVFGWLMFSVLSGCVALTCMAVIVIWTNPVFASVASLLSVFFTALADWFVFDLTPSLATYAGGIIIAAAFLLLSADTLRPAR